MKKIISTILFINLIFILSGCPKLIRRKEPDQHLPIYEEVEAESPVLNFDTYQLNYVYWKTSHDEVHDRLNAERKKRESCFDITLDYIVKMQRTFPEDKREEVKPYVERYLKFEKVVKANRISSSKKEMLRKKLNSIRRDFVKKFAPSNELIKEIFKT